MIKDQIEALVIEAVQSALSSGLLVAAGSTLNLSAAVSLNRPRLSVHGDLAVSVARIGSAIGADLAAEPLARLLSERIITICACRPGLVSAVFFSPPAFVGFTIDAPLAARGVSAIIATGISPAVPHKTAPGQARAALIKAEMFLRLALDERINILTGTIEPPVLSGRLWLDLLGQWQNDSTIFEVLFKDGASSRGAALDLVLQLAELKTLTPALASRRLALLAQAMTRFFSHFEGDQGFFNCDLSVLKARLGLIFACKQVLSERLGIMDLSIPGLA